MTFYTQTQSWVEAENAARRKHKPLYVELDVWADTECLFWKAGPLHLVVSAGDLNKCKKIDLDPALVKRMGVGHIFRIEDIGNSNPLADRILLKLWYQPNYGYTTKMRTRAQRRMADEGRSTVVLSVPQDTFLGWVVP